MGRSVLSVKGGVLDWLGHTQRWDPKGKSWGKSDKSCTHLQAHAHFVVERSLFVITADSVLTRTSSLYFHSLSLSLLNKKRPHKEGEIIMVIS